MSDQEAVAEPADDQEDAAIRVFLIRHGESESNAGLPSVTADSAPLTPRGRWQAEQIAQVIAEVPALIVTSPYRRARQTAEPTISRFPSADCQEWPVQEFTYLGDLYGRSSTASERVPHVQAYWEQADPRRRRGDGGESFTDLLRRGSDCLSRLSAQTSGPVVVFTHGLFMRAVAWSLLTGISAPGPEEMRGFRRFADRYLIPNAGVIELRCAGHEAPALMGACAIHLPGAHAPWSQ
jgi:broad specificity phosphatase PhoE